MPLNEWMDRIASLIYYLPTWFLSAELHWLFLAFFLLSLFFYFIHTSSLRVFFLTIFSFSLSTVEIIIGVFLWEQSSLQFSSWRHISQISMWREVGLGPTVWTFSLFLLWLKEILVIDLKLLLLFLSAESCRRKNCVCVSVILGFLPVKWKNGT